MSITNDMLTIAGNIGNDPIRNETKTGRPVLNFRVGSSSGYYDQRTGAWVDGGTNWYAVVAYGNLAEHAKASLRRGDPVIVSGRLKVREWEANGKKGVDVEILADAIGHDLNRGTSAFARRPRTAASETAASVTAASETAAFDRAAGAQGSPADAIGTDAIGTGATGDAGEADPTTDAERDAWRANGLTDPAAGGDQDGTGTAVQEEQELSLA